MPNDKEKRDPPILDPTIAIACKYSLLHSFVTNSTFVYV